MNISSSSNPLLVTKELIPISLSIQGNCAEFEKTVVAQCDALIEVIKQRKAELLENVAEEKALKVRTLKEQVSDCTALLQRTTGLLQFCIEVLKESDATSFLQVSHFISALHQQLSEQRR